MRVYQAPGRVNLIGEHTDYNDGFVMPVAIDRGTRVSVSPRTDQRLIVHSETTGETVEAPLDPSRLQPRRHWSDYVFGVAKELMAAGVPVTGAGLRITSNVPLGAGLSSSASLEVAVAGALLEASGQSMDKTELAKLCQRAENTFVGARCGIMDPFIATHGRAGHTLMLDCRTLDCKLLRLAADIQLVICNTMVKHSVAAGAYNTRRAECEAAAQALAARMPHVSALRDVSAEDLERHADALTDVQLRRARHVVSENARVAAAAAALEAGEVERFRALMAGSHRSLRDDFDVSCPELDLMVDLAAACDGVFGARMTGGGFGGCTINLVAADDTTVVVETLRAEYQKRTGISPDIYVCVAADGCGLVDAA
jgi:galactokinase